MGTRGNGQRRRLAVQAKRSFRVSVNDRECCDVIQDFWKDFHNHALFDRSTDGLALVVQRGSNTLLEKLSPLFDCARACKDAADFTRRLATPGYLSRDSVGYAADLKTIVQQVSSITFAEEDFWAFLRALHLLSLDLATSTSQAEGWVKALLAFTATGHDKQSAASQSWNELVVFAAQSMPRAASLALTDLPETVRARHSAIPEPNLAALQRLRDHAATTFRGIRTMLRGGLQLPREQVAARIFDLIAELPVAVITGPAGSGKSALAKQAVQQLDSNTVILAFRAEEFSATHLDQVFQAAGIAGGSEELFAMLATQGRKIIYIDAIERLLESSQREPFLDLLRLTQRDPSLTVVITCRDYSLETVQSAFLEHVGLQYDVCRVPELTDEELEAAIKALPQLRGAAAHPFLNKLFRNPYYLDKAATMSWPTDGTLPANERAFRAKFWREVVRRDDMAAAGMPTKREHAMLEVCVKRAQMLQPYAPCDDCDPDALERLRSDNLIEFAGETDGMAAPTHDALEDWAVLRWIEAAFRRNKQSPAAFAEHLGSYPAIRRAYRSWVAEMLDASPQEGDAYVTQIVQTTAVPAWFRDDTIVSGLLSSEAAAFLNRIRPILVKDNCALLCRVMHLTRVACRTTPAWLRPIGQGRALWLVPSGSAWPAIVGLVREELKQLVPAAMPLVIRFLDDWIAGVSVVIPHPDGIAHAASIGHALLPHLERYRDRELLETVLKVIIKIPTGDLNAFTTLSSRAATGDRHDQVATKFTSLLLHGIDSVFACADAPDVVVTLAVAHFKEPARGTGRDDSFHDLALEHVFGLNRHLSYDIPEASAIRGPFLPLLRYHAAKGVPFIVGLLNHACDSFAQRHQQNQYVGGPWEVTLQFPDGLNRKQWCDGRLWSLYRGTSVGPHILQCALMALEAWLLEVATSHPEYLDRWLVHLLRESNNVSITAVVASIATAFPHHSGEAGLVLLSCRDFLLLDKIRLTQDYSPPSGLFVHFPALDAAGELYRNERQQSDRREHRQRDLECVAVSLSTGPLRHRVYAIIDAHRAALPPQDQQDDEDRVWRLALHRMDFRRFEVVDTVAVEEPEADAAAPVPRDPQAPRHQVVMQPQGLEPDLGEFIKRDAPERQMFEARLALVMWATLCLSREASAKPEEWRQRLAEAIQATKDDRASLDSDRIARNAPGAVAAVCVRDHWDEMDEAGQTWAIDELVAAVLRDAGHHDMMVRVSRNTMDASRPSAYVLPLVLTHSVATKTQDRVWQAVATALTHPSDEVVAYACEGVGSHLIPMFPGHVSACVKAMVSKAMWIQQLEESQTNEPFSERASAEDLERDVRPRVVEVILSLTPCAVGEIGALNPDDWWSRQALRRILLILRHWTDTPLIQEAFSLVARTVVRWWQEDKARSHGGGHRDVQTEHEFLRQLALFCVRSSTTTALDMCSPILDAVNDHAREIDDLLKELTIAADELGQPATFWAVWQEFAKRAVDAPWLKHLDSRKDDHNEFLSVLFLGVPWKEDARHWRCLEGYGHLVDELFAALPAKPSVFRYYLRFLYQIGQQSLPNAFLLLSDRLSAGDATRILTGRSSAFYLEGILRRHVYSGPATLKARADLRDAVLHLLDALIECGSSVAYRMRDDFVTPDPDGTAPPEPITQ